MKIRSIVKLTKDWRSMTWEVIELRKVPIEKVRLLLLETYTTLHALRKKKYIPKSVCALLCEMNDFAWWVNDLENSPIHGLYPIFSTVIDEMRKEFLTGASDTKSIAKFLNGEL